jgi:hypothetical protein
MENTNIANHRLEREMFEVAQVVRGVPFQIGYCRGWKLHGELLLIQEPFTHMVLHVPYGMLSCRGPWTAGRRLTISDHMVVPCDPLVWMDLDAADLVSAIDLCASVSITLPRDGFRRI